MRLQKILAWSGYGSRREIEKWIKEGRIKINQQVATLGSQVEESDEVLLDGQRCTLRRHVKPELWMLNKPVGTWCTKVDKKDQPSVFGYCPEPGPWFMVGRLDVNTSGLLLFTNYGPWAHELMHPSFQHHRTYLVRVAGEVTEKTIQALHQGVMLEDGLAQAVSIHWLRRDRRHQHIIMVMAEGRNRIVRRMWEKVGCSVSRLKRIAFAGIELPHGLKPGEMVRVRQLPKGLSQPK